LSFFYLGKEKIPELGKPMVFHGSFQPFSRVYPALTKTSWEYKRSGSPAIGSQKPTKNTEE